MEDCHAKEICGAIDNDGTDIAGDHAVKGAARATELRLLLEEDYAEAQKVILVCDNLNTHKLASF